MENAKIKIYVVLFKQSYVPNNELLYPIQAGAEISNSLIQNVIHDNEGDNISSKNKSYCELTAQYWAWKNEDADYYGFFHYRRYLIFNPIHLPEDGWGSVVYNRIDQQAIDEIMLDEETMTQLILRYDVITVQARELSCTNEEKSTIYKDYSKSEYQHSCDLDKAIKILIKKYPEYREAVSEYMESSKAFECNMFIMNKKEYHKYCSWLFDILFEIENIIICEHYSAEENRAIGFIGERLFGIYYTFLKKQSQVKTCELQKTMFIDTDLPIRMMPVFAQGIPIVLAANNKFTPYLSTMIQSIIDNASVSRKYDIIVLHQDITDENQRIIRRQGNADNISIRFVNVKVFFDNKELFIDQHLSIETYYRLVVPDIMKDYNKILYLDSDMVVNADVANLYDIDLGDNILAAAKDIDVAGQAKSSAKQVNYLTAQLKLESPYDYFQAGVLVICLNRLREITTVDELLKIATSYDWKCHDQDVLNSVCKNQITYLPQKWNTVINWTEGSHQRMNFLKRAPMELYSEYTAARKEPLIIHYAGYQKPWNFLACDMCQYFWEYARKTPYYEQIMLNKNLQNNLLQSIGFTSQVQNSDMNGIKISGLDDAIYIDGVMIHFIRKINKVFPIGSRRRERIKKIAGIFVK